MKNIKLVCDRIINKQDINYEKIDFQNAEDIANGSLGVVRVCVYNTTIKKYRYEYYLCKVIKNNYIVKKGQYNHHFFRLEVVQVLNGKKKNVGDIFTRNGKQLYKNYHELRQAKYVCRNAKHKQKFDILKMAIA